MLREAPTYGGGFSRYRDWGLTSNLNPWFNEYMNQADDSDDAVALRCDECGDEAVVVVLFRGTAMERRAWEHVGPHRPSRGAHAVTIGGAYDSEIGD